MPLIFFMSGAAALIYQIVWAKQLSLVFGVTIFATSAVVTSFMAGLALGSLYFGRLVDRWGRPLVLFALLELGIAVFALLFPFIAAGLKPIYAALYGPFGHNHYVMSLVRFVLSFLVLLVPTSLMGGTLPALSKAYVSRAERLGGEVAWLYSANNLGAFVGCVSAGYLFLEFFGQRGSLLLAALLNLAVVGISLCLDARMPWPGRAEAPEAGAREAAPAEGGSLPRPVKVALWVFGIEGFTSLAYQMAWMRMLIFFVETNIYAITAIVATFLVGLSLGAFLVKRWVDRTPDPYRMLGLIEIGIGLTALATIPLLPRMLHHYGDFQTMLWRWGWAGWTMARFTITFVVILVPTCFMGATMPVVSRIYVPALRGLGRKMGVIGCLDTVGSILGAFAGGFILIPLLGIQRTIIATALINLALAAWVFAADPVPGRRTLLRAGFLVSVAALLAAPLLLFLKPVPLVAGSRTIKPILQGELLYYSEDVESTVSVVEAYGFSRLLLVDHAGAAQTGRFDRVSHELVGHVPLLLHADPKRALIIGLGIGFSAWACRVQGVDVDVVELSAGVRRANRWFKQYTEDILSDERVNLRIDDGRNYVLGTDQTYDMIQAGIIHPALNSGSAGFYTVDFYRECERILAPGGVMCQWLPLHQIPHEDFKMLIRSFQAAFPYTSIWYKNTSQHCMLIGTMKPLRIDFPDIESRVNRPAVRAHLARSEVQDVYDLLDSFCCADNDVRRAVGPGPLHTDDRPLMEFHSQRPISIFAYPDNISLFGRARRPVWPRLVNIPPQKRADVRARFDRWYEATQYLIRGHYGGALLQSLGPEHGDYRQVFEEMNAVCQRVLELNPEDKNAEIIWKENLASHEMMMARQSMRKGRRDEEVLHLRKVVEIAPGTYNAAEAGFLLERALAANAQRAN